MVEISRCDWAAKSKLEQEYHDHEWGRPVHNDKALFKMLMLEGKQAGLSWSTILAKRAALCQAFDDFDPFVVAGYGEEKIESLLQNDGIIRNRQKIKAVISNAKAYIQLCEEKGSFDHYLWAYVGGKPILNAWRSIEDIPAKTALSDEISADLKKRGFKFVGSITVYAFMQAVGMVNDHLITCHLYPTS